MKHKYVKSYENFTEANDYYKELPYGTKVKRDMGIRESGVVIPWFYWKDATDGTFSEPDKSEQVAIKWDDGTIGFEYIQFLTIIHDDGTFEPLGRYITDEEYDTTSDEFTVLSDTKQIEFEDGTVDNYTIYDDDKIAFDKWYPDNKYQMLVDAIEQKQKDED